MTQAGPRRSVKPDVAVSQRQGRGHIPTPPIPPVPCANIVTDYGGVGDGVTNNDVAFIAYRTQARTETNSCLTLPTGNYITTIAGTGGIPFDGISNFILHGNGSTISTGRPTCTAGMPGDADHSARVNDVAIGATTLTLVTPAQISRFAVGDWCLLDALEMQASGGYPPNHHYCQYVNITKIVDSTITFTPAAVNHYRTTYPVTSSPTYDTGGPATLHKMIPFGTSIAKSWNTDTTVENVIWDNEIGPSGSQIYSPGKKIRLTDCTFVNCAIIPTVCHDFLALRCTSLFNEVEVDKEVDIAVFDDCDIAQIKCQSSSVQQLTLSNCRIGVIAGTVRNTIIENTTITNPLGFLRLGVEGYGYSETITMSNVNSPILVLNAQKLLRSDFSLVGSVLTWNNIDFEAIIRFAIPGAKYYLGAGGGGEYTNQGSPFIITDVYMVAGKVTMDTTLTSLPATVVDFNDYIIKAPCGSLTATNCTGCNEMEGASLAGPGAMPFTRGRRIGDFSGPDSSAYHINAIGRFVSITVNVIQPYTGGQPTSVLQVGNVFQNWPAINISTWMQTESIAAVINLKIAGIRTFTPGSTTGLQAGDLVFRNGVPAAALGDFWLGRGILPYNGTDMSGDSPAQKPIIQYDIQMTWGI